MASEAPPDLLKFVRGETEPAAFPHREHVRMAYEMLRRHPFDETVLHYSRGLRAVAAKAGHPQAFHQTLTVAFLAVIAERMGEAPGEFDDFARAHADLFDKALLRRWYRPERLDSAAARRTFLLPDAPA